MENEADWWSCKIVHYVSVDEFDSIHRHGKLQWQRYQVVRTTPKGVVLKEFVNEFLVLGKAIRQRAVPTKELALQDAIAKKKRHIKGCEHRLQCAQGDLRILERPFHG